MSVLQELTRGVAFGPILRGNMVKFLVAHRCEETAGHSMQVAAEARRIAQHFQLNPAWAEMAGWLHDISAVIPKEQRVIVAEQVGLAVLEAERIFPMIAHQRLSAVIAEELFGVHEPAVLSAIGCHTTLKANASDLDKAVFVADKIKWDQTGTPPYLAAVEAGLAISLDEAAYRYLDYLFEHKEQLRVVHPWALEAYMELGEKVRSHQ